MLEDVKGTLVNMIRPRGFAERHPHQLGFYPPTETGRWAGIARDGYISKGWHPHL